MLEEEEKQRGGRGTGRLGHFEWPPKTTNNFRVDNGDPGACFFSSVYLCPSPALKRVAWPPPPEERDLIEAQPVYTKAPAYNADSAASNEYQQDYENYSAPVTLEKQQPAPAAHQLYHPQAVYLPPPSTVTLRSEAPISQAPPPVFTSQPAATRGIGPKMRGDEKWPPAANKAQSAAENEARLALAKGPACRPRKVKKDYSSFFAQNQLTPNYPAYRAPPGTQHYVEEGTSNF